MATLNDDNIAAKPVSAAGVATTVITNAAAGVVATTPMTYPKLFTLLNEAKPIDEICQIVMDNIDLVCPLPQGLSRRTTGLKRVVVAKEEDALTPFPGGTNYVPELAKETGDKIVRYLGGQNDGVHIHLMPNSSMWVIRKVVRNAVFEMNHPTANFCRELPHTVRDCLVSIDTTRGTGGFDTETYVCGYRINSYLIAENTGDMERKLGSFIQYGKADKKCTCQYPMVIENGSAKDTFAYTFTHNADSTVASAKCIIEYKSPSCNKFWESKYVLNNGKLEGGLWNLNRIKVVDIYDKMSVTRKYVDDVCVKVVEVNDGTTITYIKDCNGNVTEITKKTSNGHGDVKRVFDDCRRVTYNESKTIESDGTQNIEKFTVVYTDK